MTEDNAAVAQTPETPTSPVNHHIPHTVESRALVPTERPGRYGKQLAAHMGRKVPATWDEVTQTGVITFFDEAARARLAATDDGLDMTMTAIDAAALDRFEWVLGIHLIRFGAREDMECHWIRSDGAPGTSQTPHDLEERAKEKAAQKEAAQQQES
ncbi:DUF2218 domain-containing protein [Brevibacterium sp. 50QC2O2]|jgi:hypothetical protein|uniref:DUF2218 domain-containing protein n=1 Tax=Brevibacterium TaxID=1696 RepID=UPI00211C0AB1|nr:MULTISPECIES: DUF2218 domain-containing protein [unclassified Brevibacterium]MCQ9369138.1 DUF2218 domain-containing protein [Brevibacterium sp. 91QC2O2]MCQ9386495.1 DUF2218 domain-containing protein [Brevibacterium sp. 68QC2CO]MCQ9389279.1 DUF2218 domain-containing protein [Brevibacterium sp. 50QC2O2]